VRGEAAHSYFLFLYAYFFVGKGLAEKENQQFCDRRNAFLIN